MPASFKLVAVMTPPKIVRSPTFEEPKLSRADPAPIPAPYRKLEAVMLPFMMVMCVTLEIPYRVRPDPIPAPSSLTDVIALSEIARLCTVELPKV
jgi:hypothetical protein